MVFPGCNSTGKSLFIRICHSFFSLSRLSHYACEEPFYSPPELVIDDFFHSYNPKIYSQSSSKFNQIQKKTELRNISQENAQRKEKSFLQQGSRRRILLQNQLFTHCPLTPKVFLSS